MPGKHKSIIVHHLFQTISQNSPPLGNIFAVVDPLRVSSKALAGWNSCWSRLIVRNKAWCLAEVVTISAGAKQASDVEMLRVSFYPNECKLNLFVNTFTNCSCGMNETICILHFPWFFSMEGDSQKWTSC